MHGALSASRCRLSFFISVWVGACLGSVGTAWESQAQTSIATPTPAGTFISQIVSPSREETADEEISWTLNKLPSQQYMKEVYWQHPSDRPAFFRDSLLQYVVRTYYLGRDNFNDSKSQAWAGGGWLAFRSGLVGDMFGMHAAYYTSQRLFGPEDEGGTRLLNPDQEPLGMLGQLYGRLQIFDQELRGGRQLVDTPLINPQDNRMAPNTFDGIAVVTLPDKDRRYDYAVGYLWSIKQRDSNDFISMSDALKSGDNADQGAMFGMVKYRPFSGLTTIFMDYYVPDFLNAAFAQAEYNFRRPKEVPNWIIGANIIAQQSVGDDLLTGGSFQTYQATAKVLMKYAGWTLSVAGAITGEGSQIFAPFGTKPAYTDMQQVAFDNAGEKAVGGSIEYDFGTLGLHGVSAGVWFTQGWDAINPANNQSIADRSELDLWLQYRPTEGPMKGVRLRTQYSNVWQEDNTRDVQPEFRFIVDYTVLFRPPIK